MCGGWFEGFGLQHEAVVGESPTASQKFSERWSRIQPLQNHKSEPKSLTLPSDTGLCCKPQCPWLPLNGIGGWERRASRQAHAVCGRVLGLSWHQMRLDLCCCSHRPAFSRDGLNDVHWYNDQLGADLHCNFGGRRSRGSLPTFLERGSAAKPSTTTTIVQPGFTPGSSWLHRDAPHSPPHFPAGANSILLCRNCSRLQVIRSSSFVPCCPWAWVPTPGSRLSYQNIPRQIRDSASCILSCMRAQTWSLGKLFTPTLPIFSAIIDAMPVLS